MSAGAAAQLRLLVLLVLAAALGGERPLAERRARAAGGGVGRAGRRPRLVVVLVVRGGGLVQRRARGVAAAALRLWQRRRRRRQRLRVQQARDGRQAERRRRRVERRRGGGVVMEVVVLLVRKRGCSGGAAGRGCGIGVAAGATGEAVEALPRADGDLREAGRAARLCVERVGCCFWGWWWPEMVRSRPRGWPAGLDAPKALQPPAWICGAAARAPPLAPIAPSQCMWQFHMHGAAWQGWWQVAKGRLVSLHQGSAMLPAKQHTHACGTAAAISRTLGRDLRNLR